MRKVLTLIFLFVSYPTFAATLSINGTVDPRISNITLTETLSCDWGFCQEIVRGKVQQKGNAFRADINLKLKSQARIHIYLEFDLKLNGVVSREAIQLQDDSSAPSELNGLTLNCRTYLNRYKRAKVDSLVAFSDCDQPGINLNMTTASAISNMNIRYDSGKFSSGRLLATKSIGRVTFDLYDNGYGVIGPLSVVVVKHKLGSKMDLKPGQYNLDDVYYGKDGKLVLFTLFTRPNPNSDELIGAQATFDLNYPQISESESMFDPFAASSDAQLKFCDSNQHNVFWSVKTKFTYTIPVKSAKFGVCD